MKRDIVLGGEAFPVSLVRHGTGATLVLADKQHYCTLQNMGAGEYRLSMDGKTHRVWVAISKSVAFVHTFGRSWELEVINPAERAIGGAGSGENITTAPMPGTVVSVMVKVGASVHRGQPLLIIESMKMQTEISARRDGTIEAVLVATGDTFDRGARLVALKAEA